MDERDWLKPGWVGMMSAPLADSALERRGSIVRYYTEDRWWEFDLIEPIVTHHAYRAVRTPW